MRLAPLCIVLASHTVVAEPIGEDDPPAVSRDDEPTAVDVTGAPLPGAESGRIDPGEPIDSTARKVGRGVLFVPRLAVGTVFAPVRAGIWAYDRYQLKERYLDLFFNDARTFGVLPTATLESGYGFTFGAKLVHEDLFGGRERLRLRAATGGRFRQLATVALASGDRFGRRFGVELDGRFERRPHDVFYGIGDAGTSMPEARFRQQLARAALASELRIAGPLRIRASGALADFELGRGDDGPAIDELYPAETMTGFDGVRHGYLELEVAWDSRRHARPWEVAAIPATGWLVLAFGGRTIALDDNADYWRYGGDIQRFLRVGAGPRVVSARLYGEAVGGSLTEVPFTQLPRLGGATLLRGYSADRFRDRVAALGSIAYSWDISRALSTSVFVDAGRVFPSVRDVELSGLRLGYGVELEAHTARAFVMRIGLASSVDGGVFLDLAFDPVFDLSPRTERR
jgi:hypothetical protein